MVQHTILPYFPKISEKINNTQVLDQAALRIIQVHCSFPASTGRLIYQIVILSQSSKHMKFPIKLDSCFKTGPMFKVRACKERRKKPHLTRLLSLASDPESEEAVNTTALGNKSLARLGKAFLC